MAFLVRSPGLAEPGTVTSPWGGLKGGKPAVWEWGNFEPTSKCEGACGWKVAHSTTHQRTLGPAVFAEWRSHHGSLAQSHMEFSSLVFLLWTLIARVRVRDACAASLKRTDLQMGVVKHWYVFAERNLRLGPLQVGRCARSERAAVFVEKRKPGDFHKNKNKNKRTQLLGLSLHNLACLGPPPNPPPPPGQPVPLPSSDWIEFGQFSRAQWIQKTKTFSRF